MKKLFYLFAILALTAAAGAQHIGAMLDASQPFSAPQFFQSTITMPVFSDTGTANNYNVCPTGVVTPSAGTWVAFNATSSNTGASTLQICGGTAINIVKNQNQFLTNGDIIGGFTVVAYYNGALFIDLNPATSGALFETNGIANAAQGALNIINSNSLTCTNPGTNSVQCTVGPNLNVTSLAFIDSADSGTTNAYASCPGGSIVFGDGQVAVLNAGSSNTGGSTYNFCSNGALAVKKAGGLALVAGDIVSGGRYLLYYSASGGYGWQLMNPSSTSSGTVSGQQQGQPAIGNTSSTLTTMNATFVATAMTGADICAKIKAALNLCPASSTAACKVIVPASTPGSIDVCSAANSNFFSGVPGSIVVDLDLETSIQLKAPVVFPAIAHLVHGIGSSQTVRGTGFIMDPTFADAANLCNFTTGTDGPFTTGHYLCLVIDGGGNWGNNAFGGKWRDLYFDCNGVTNCIPFFTGNEQEDSEWVNIRVWGNAVNSATSISACGFWDHGAATGGNTGPSHIRILHSFCDPWGNGSTGTTSNNTIYGFVYEGTGSGGNILIEGATVRASSATALMDDGVWIDGSNLANVEDIHCEWLSTACVVFNGCTGCKASNISQANHSADGVLFENGATGTAYNIQAQGPEVQDTPNGCTTAGSTLEWYSTDDGGQGWWNNAPHVCGSGLTDRTGTMTFSAATSATYTLHGSYTTAPQCQITLTSNPGTTVFWVTATTSVVTAHSSASFSGTVNYECNPRGN